MIKLSLIVRSLFRQTLNTLIIVSLAVGMACLNLIAMFIQREMNTDGFHADKERIYAVKCDYKGATDIKQWFECGRGAAEYMKNNFSQVEDFCRLYKVYDPNPKVVVNNDTYFDKSVILQTSKNFFMFFSYDLLTNNPSTALDAMNSIVISEELAHKYFGSNDAVGKVIYLAGDKNEPMTVTGVFRKPLDNSQLNFDMIRLIPDGWMSACYVKLKKHSDPGELENILKANKDKMNGIQAGIPGVYHLKSLCDDYFTDSISRVKKNSRDKNDLWIAFFIGLIIMSIATFNYLGLLHNNLLEKTKVYAIQRVNGGTKSGFVLSFMAESLIVVGLSFFLSILLMIWLAPFFNKLTNTNITAGFVFRPGQVLILCTIVVLLLFITFLSVNLRIKTNVDLQSLKPGNIHLRKQVQFPAFNIFQLASSIILILISAVILKQTRFITNKSIGLDKKVIEVKIPPNYSGKLSALKKDLLSSPSIDQVSQADGTPFNWGDLVTLKMNENGVNEELKLYSFYGDEHYMSTIGIQIIEGKGFSGNPSIDRYKVLVNESLVRLFPGKNLIGTILPGYTRIDQSTKKNRELTIAGIVKDFQYLSLKSVIEPAAICYDETGEKLLVKPTLNQITQANQAIAQIWKKHIPGYPLETETIGDQFEWLHRENKNYLKLISACCFISLFLSMIGLFAISYRSSQCRTKEIGIRKVNGAKILEILIMLNKDLVKWIAIAFVIACPIAWYVTRKWLENFAYKTELNWWIFALAGFIALGIALLTVSWQSWKAATRNPVEALRYE